MGEADGITAKSWLFEFEKNGIDFDGIVLIGNNLGEQSRPEFIPNVFVLIKIAKTLKKQKAEQHRNYAAQRFLSPKNILELRLKTKDSRLKSMRLMRETLGKKVN